MQYMIVGLGNPGDAYEHTRHNIGRDIVRMFADCGEFSEWHYNKYANAQYTSGVVNDTEVALLLPETFMNHSGESVLYMKKKQGIHPEHIIVVHDDLDMSMGSMKIHFARGTGGHNGLSSIVRSIGTQRFTRVRIGIAPVIDGVQRKPQGEKEVINFVLKQFTPQEKDILSEVTKRTIQGLVHLITEGRDSAMNTYN